jgi:hypothetical protein
VIDFIAWQPFHQLIDRTVVIGVTTFRRELVRDRFDRRLDLKGLAAVGLVGNAALLGMSETTQ